MSKQYCDLTISYINSNSEYLQVEKVDITSVHCLTRQRKISAAFHEFPKPLKSSVALEIHGVMLDAIQYNLSEKFINRRVCKSFVVAFSPC